MFDFGVAVSVVASADVYLCVQSSIVVGRLSFPRLDVPPLGTVAAVGWVAEIGDGRFDDVGFDLRLHSIGWCWCQVGAVDS